MEQDDFTEWCAKKGLTLSKQQQEVAAAYLAKPKGQRAYVLQVLKLFESRENRDAKRTTA